MKEKVVAYIRENRLLEPGAKVLVALSGGPDSVALLRLMVSLRRSWKLQLGAVHLNHQIRRRGAVADQKFCVRLCNELGVEFFSETRDVPALARKWKMSLEEAARKCRYDLFEEIVHRESYDCVALGHHRDDQAETVLFRIIRGTGRTGLVGMAPRRGIYIRPLLSVTRAEITEFLDSNEFDYRVDRSNYKSDHARNYIRNRLIPAIAKNLNPAVSDQLASMADILGEEERFLETLSAKAAAKIVSRRDSGRYEIECKAFNDLDLWLRRRVVRSCLAELSLAGQAPDRATIDRVVQMAGEPARRRSLPGKVVIEVTKEKLYLASGQKLSFNSDLRIDGATRIDPIGRTFVTSTGSGSFKLLKQRRSRRVTVSRSALKLPLVVRSIRPGDRFTPLGMRGSKKIGDYLTDRKVPPLLRDEIAVVCDRKGIIWLAGFEIAERVRIDQDTKEALTIEFY